MRLSIYCALYRNDYDGTKCRDLMLCNLYSDDGDRHFLFEIKKDGSSAAEMDIKEADNLGDMDQLFNSSNERLIGSNYQNVDDYQICLNDSAKIESFHVNKENLIRNISPLTKATKSHIGIMVKLLFGLPEKNKGADLSSSKLPNWGSF